MNYIRVIGTIALVLGSFVLIVASYVSIISAEQIVIEPFALGVTAILAGFLCLKKSAET